MAQAGQPDFGIYAHQIRATPGNKTLTLCSRGNDATATKPEDPGHIEVFGFKDGQLSNLQSIAPHGNGLGFGPRHLDFAPNGRFVYVSLERENSLAVFGLKPDGTLSAEPLFYKSALTDPDIYRIPEEEVARSGTRVLRAVRRTRWVDGSTFLWTARRRRAGLGGVASGLRSGRCAAGLSLIPAAYRECRRCASPAIDRPMYTKFPIDYSIHSQEVTWAM